MTSTPEMINAAMIAYAQHAERSVGIVSPEGIKAAVTAALAMQWQTIKTAPKDGRTVLIGCSAGGDRRWIASGFHNGLYWTNNHDGLSGATHWHQMPDPPNDGNEK